MVLTKPNDHDLTKLHAEINQLVNQRFLLTTLAVTIFGVGAGWILQKNRDCEVDVGWFTYGASILLILVLAGLFLLHQRLLSQMRIFTTYLVETGTSPWEDHWDQYRQYCKAKTRVPLFRGHEYTDAQALVFSFLGLSVGLIPVLVKFAFGLRWDPWQGWLFTLSAVSLYLCFVWVGRYMEPDERRLKSYWRKALKLDSSTAEEAGEEPSPGSRQ